jgi:hypothetical protein
MEAHVNEAEDALERLQKRITHTMKTDQEIQTTRASWADIDANHHDLIFVRCFADLTSRPARPSIEACNW